MIYGYLQGRTDKEQNMDKQVKAVIFDFDYTLGDSTLGIIQSVNHGLKNMGYSIIPDEQIRRTIGLSLQDTYKGNTCAWSLSS